MLQNSTLSVMYCKCASFLQYKSSIIAALFQHILLCQYMLQFREGNYVNALSRDEWDRCIRQRQPATQWQQFVNALQTEWTNIEQQFIQNHTPSMERPCPTVIVYNGGHVWYYVEMNLNRNLNVQWIFG